ncbi:hypothetical protein LJR225_004860 [Phenylobacterium sp. LjRoot225]|uniref:hypothetical protein n=1 Tax=Phenylobacterium sp. LjRoot225 TaxID=3342285 RepID=UPI003ECD05BA
MKASGFYVPESLAPYAKEGLFNHLALAVVARPDFCEVDDIDHAVGLRRPAARTLLTEEIQEGLEFELSAIDDDATVIISSEHIHSRVNTTERMMFLREFLSPFFEDFIVVVYIRSQYHMARSLTNTALRQGQVVRKGVPDFCNDEEFDPELPVHKGFFDLKLFVERLSAAFGEEALRVRLYPEGRPAPELIADFCAVAGCALDGLELPSRENASFSGQASQICGLVNELMHERGHDGRLQYDLLRYLDSEHQGAGLVAEPAEVAEFMRLFEQDNDVIRSRWLPHRNELFSNDFGQHDGPERTLSIKAAVEMMLAFIAWRERFGSGLSNAEDRSAADAWSAWEPAMSAPPSPDTRQTLRP